MTNKKEIVKKGQNICKQIREMFANGLTREEVIDEGFKKSTVQVQWSKFNKQNENVENTTEENDDNTY